MPALQLEANIVMLTMRIKETPGVIDAPMLRTKCEEHCLTLALGVAPGAHGDNMRHLRPNMSSEQASRAL